jgi:Spy/CpxP family protein refolding chaperone
VRHPLLSVILIAGLGTVAGAQPPQAPPARATELKAYLGLTDDQMTSFQALRKQMREKTAALNEQTRANRKALTAQLAASSASASAVGQLQIDIQKAEQALREARAETRVQALALLTVDQKTKLAVLEAAQKLRTEVEQAVGLDLLSGAGAGGPGPGGRRGPGGPGGPGGRGAGPAELQ